MQSAIKVLTYNEDREVCIYGLIQGTQVVQMRGKKKLQRHSDIQVGFSKFNRSYLGRSWKGVGRKNYQEEDLEMYCYADPLRILWSR